MPAFAPRHPHSAQTGGITILVALMMLVLLTLASIGMSRNSFRDVVSSGFSRQAALANDVADSGLEWSMYWFDLSNEPQAQNSAANLYQLQETLLKNQTLSGVAKSITDPTGGTNYLNGSNVLPTGLPLATDLTLPAPPKGVAAQGYTIGLTSMGKLAISGMSQGAGQGGYTPAAGGPVTQAPNLWAIRSDAQVQQGSVTFVHAKEAWVSTPVQ